MHPIAPPLPKGVNIIVMGEGLLVSSLGIMLASARCGWSHLILWGLPIGTHCRGMQLQPLVMRSCLLQDFCPDSRLFIAKCALCI